MTEASLGQTELAERKEWLLRRAPAMPKKACDQLVALWPVYAVANHEHAYLDRMTFAGTFEQDRETGVRYIALVWPTGNKRILRLYVDLPTGEAFLYERDWTQARDLLTLSPELPRGVKRGVAEYINRHAPTPAPE